MARPISLPPCPSFRQPPPRSEGILRPIKGVRRDRSRPVPNVYPRGFVSPPHVRPRHRYSGACTGMTSKGENQSPQKSEGLWFQNGSKPYMRPLGMTCGYSLAPQVQRRRFPLTPCYMRGCLFPPRRCGSPEKKCGRSRFPKAGGRVRISFGSCDGFGRLGLVRREPANPVRSGRKQR